MLIPIFVFTALPYLPLRLDHARRRATGRSFPGTSELRGSWTGVRSTGPPSICAVLLFSLPRVRCGYGVGSSACPPRAYYYYLVLSIYTDLISLCFFIIIILIHVLFFLSTSLPLRSLFLPRGGGEVGHFTITYPLFLYLPS